MRIEKFLETLSTWKENLAINLIFFIGAVGLFFLIPYVLLNTHPALQEIVTRTPVHDGIVQFLADANENVELVITSAKIPADLYQATPENIYFALVPNENHTIRLKGIGHFSQPIDQFDFNRHILFENQLNASSVIVHLKGNAGADVWELVRPNLISDSVRCQAPTIQSNLKWEVCTGEIDPALIRHTIIQKDGWSPIESWGVWTLKPTVKAAVVTHKYYLYQVEVEWFPNCIEGQIQTADVFINNVKIGSEVWEDCATKISTFEIPSDSLRERKRVIDFNHSFFENELIFNFNYATQPIDPESGEAIDPRPLAVAFNKILITPIGQK